MNEQTWRREIELALAAYVVKMGIKQAGEKLSWYKAEDIRKAIEEMADTVPCKQAVSDLLKEIQIHGTPPAA